MSKATKAAAAAVLAGTLALGLWGLGRSLWLDEAWVANSLRAASLSEMFRYGDWLQTSPPLFLLTARFAVAVLGLSTITLRIVSLAFALAAVGTMFLAARRTVGSAWAVLAVAVLAYHPTSMEYFRAFKQYGGEVAATGAILWAAAAYLRAPGRGGFVWLLAAVAVALPLSYPAVFLVPGITLAVASLDARRAAVIAAVAAAEMALLYWFFIAPNLSPALWTYWKEGNPNAYSPTTWAVILFGLAIAIRLTLQMLRGRRGWREWIQVVCLLPCLALLLAELAGWYPASPRTRLFVRPCLVLLAVIAAEDLLGRWRMARPVALAASLAVMAVGLQGQIRAHVDQPFEDYAAAVTYLRAHVGPHDRLLVHTSARQGFLLYAAIAAWDPPALYGDTGWPCCRRVENSAPHSSTPGAVFADLQRLVPEGFKGRVWLLYSTRPAHWEYTGLDEGSLWRNHLWDRGCLPGPYIELPNLAISPMNCAAPNSP